LLSKEFYRYLRFSTVPQGSISENCTKIARTGWFNRCWVEGHWSAWFQ